MTIYELPPSVVAQIAAGEVVERPANIVKELVENSLDAGATKISVSTEQGGIGRITVADNGSGMVAQDIPLAVKRHATSKIQTVEDLSDIHTLGFRGEALASVCSVSKVTIISKTKESSSGTKVVLHAGEIKESVEQPANTGTIIDIEDLFYNVPARKKFLRNATTEFTHIVEIISQYSLLNPLIEFELINNGKVSIRSPSATNMKDKISHIHGVAVAKLAHEVSYSQNGISINGFISDPAHTRSDKSGITLFLNNRYVKNPQLYQAINKGYETLLMIGKHPYAVLHIDVDANTVDVNVHPRKDIVKFSDEQTILDAIKIAVKNCLSPKEYVRETQDIKTHDLTWQDSMQTRSDEITFEQKSVSSQPQYITPSIVKQEVSEQLTLGEKQESLQMTPDVIESKLEKAPSLEYVGILLKTYIICNSEDGIILIDFHAAHERYLYEKFKESYQNEQVKSQTLMEPKMIDANPHILAKLDVHQEFIESLGIDASHFGENTIALRKIPILIDRQLPIDFIMKIIESLPDDEQPSSDVLDAWKERTFATMGCRAAYKAGDNLSSELAKKIVKWLLTSEQRFACPHGRPIFISVSSYELEKMFKRKV